MSFLNMNLITATAKLQKLTEFESAKYALP